MISKPHTKSAKKRLGTEMLATESVGVGAVRPTIFFLYKNIKAEIGEILRIRLEYMQG